MSDALGIQSLPGFWYDLGQIIYLESLLGGIIKYVKTPSTEPIYSKPGPSLSPSEWLERNNTSDRVTIRHIQLYLIICKKWYSGRVTHSLSQQKANAICEKPLPKIWNCVTLHLHLDALKSWGLALWQLVSPSTQ